MGGVGSGMKPGVRTNFYLSKDKHLGFYVTDEQYFFVCKQAENLNITNSEYLRILLEKERSKKNDKRRENSLNPISG